MPKEPEPKRGLVARIENKAFPHVYPVEFSGQTLARMELLRRLRHHPDYAHHSYILYFNHVAYNDPVLATYVAKQIDPDRTKKLFAPSSAWSSRLTLKNIPYILMIMTARINGVRMQPVVQQYQVDNPTYGYTQDDALKSYRKLFKTARAIHNQGPVFCLISPEGHRSETGALQDSITKGVLGIGRILTPVVYIPLGITFPDGYERDSFNFHRRSVLEIGNIRVQEAVAGTPSIPDLMSELAAVLPPQMRGVWKPAPEPTGPGILPDLIPETATVFDAETA